MNLILIDLKQYNHPKLREIALQFDWNQEVLVMFKDNNIAKIWVDVDTKDVVAYTTKKDNNIKLGDEFMVKLSSMSPYQLPKKDKVTNLTLDLDFILEKISSTGLDSLTKDEKNFLSNLNK